MNDTNCNLRLKKPFSALNHVFLLLRNDGGTVRVMVSPPQRCVLLRWCMLGVGLSNILSKQFPLQFDVPISCFLTPPPDPRLRLENTQISVPEEQHDGKGPGGRWWSPEPHRHLEGVLQELLGDVEAVVVGLPALQEALLLTGLMEDRPDQIRSDD